MINLSIFCIYLACNNGCSHQGEQTQLFTHTEGGGYQGVGGLAQVILPRISESQENIKMITLYEYQVAITGKYQAVITGSMNITMITLRLNAYVVI